jgi:membrane-bound serine protease (ClpP class)
VGGVAAVVLEVCFWSGHGMVAVAGVVAILASLALALVGHDALPLGVAVSLGWVTHAVARVMGSLMMTGAAMVVLSRWLGQSRLARRFVLETAITAHAGPSGDAPDDRDGGGPFAHALLGAEGVATTALRPAGKARIGGERVDVVTEGDYVEAGVAVVVVAVEGARVVVRKKA